MRPGLILAGVAAALLAASAVAAAAPKAEPVRAPAMAWGTSFDSAEAAAKQTNRLAMVDFYADWCVACKVMDREVYPSRAVIQASQQFVPVKLDVDHDGKALADKYVVNMLPAILFMDGDGHVIDTIVGAETAKDFVSDLNRIAREYREFPSKEQQAQAHPEDIPLAVSVAVGLVERGRYTDAVSLTSRIEAQGAKASRYIGEAYNRLGEYYFLQDDPAPAIPWYQKTINCTTAPEFIAAAHMQLAGCYFEQHNDEQGTDELREVVRTPGAPGPLRDRAFQILTGGLQH